jgi:MFS family permease
MAAPRPVAGAFIALGAFWGSWAVSIADVQRTFRLSDGALGTLLAVAIGVAGVTGAVVSNRADRWGTGPMLTWSLLGWAVLLVGTGIARPWPVFAVCFCAAEVAGGCVDTAMNASASRRLTGRPGALVRFHALFNTGALSGAALAGTMIGLGVSWRFLWPTLAIGVGALCLWVHRTQRPGATGVTAPTGRGAAVTVFAGGAAAAELLEGRGGLAGAVSRLRADGLLLFLGVFALAEIAEGGVDTWGVLYLRTHLASGILLGAGAYVVGQSVAAATRGAGGPMLGRLSPRIALVVGGFVAGSGILLESTSTRAVVAAAGLAFGAAGASLFWPLVMSQVTRQASRPTAAVGAFTAAGYVGWVGGAPLVGWISTRHPALGLQVLAGLVAVVIVASLLRRDTVPGPAPVSPKHTRAG